MFGRRKTRKEESVRRPDFYIWHDRPITGGTMRVFLPETADLSVVADLQVQLGEVCEVVDIRIYDSYCAVQWMWPSECHLDRPTPAAQVVEGVERLVIGRLALVLGVREPQVERIGSRHEYEETARRLGKSLEWMLGGS